MADSSALASTELIEKWECFHPLVKNDITLLLKFKTQFPDIKNVAFPSGQNQDEKKKEGCLDKTALGALPGDEVILKN